MTAHNDIELLLWCARNLPDVSFVFAGQITGGDYSGLKRLDNVYFLGRIPYEKIPKLCASFDVCMLQWKMNEWIRCCNPLKMFEYMASGKPIVSVPIEEAKQYSDIISIAHSKEQFAEAIRWELQNDTTERARKRIEIAKNHSWDEHVEKISELIENTITTKQSGRFHLASQSLGEISR
jgi:glycosyltransferase involved in cell wall biosynthesis